MKLTGKDLINTYIENDNGKLLKLYMETCSSVGLHVFHDGNEAFDAEFYRSGLFIACNEYSDPSSEGVLQLFMTDEDLGYELTWEELAKMNIDNLATQTPEEKEALDSIKSVHLRDYQKADKPHVKVEYEKVTESIFDLRKEFERGELHYVFSGENWFTFNDEASLVVGFKEGNVYRRIEITESPQQREERERDEKAKQIMIDVCGDDAFKDRGWDYHKKFTHSAKIAFKLVDLGYRKESN